MSRFIVDISGFKPYKCCLEIKSYKKYELINSYMLNTIDGYLLINSNHKIIEYINDSPAGYNYMIDQHLEIISYQQFILKLKLQYLLHA